MHCAKLLEATSHHRAFQVTDENACPHSAPDLPNLLSPQNDWPHLTPQLLVPPSMFLPIIIDPNQSPAPLHPDRIMSCPSWCSSEAGQDPRSRTAALASGLLLCNSTQLLSAGRDWVRRSTLSFQGRACFFIHLPGQELTRAHSSSVTGFQLPSNNVQFPGNRHLAEHRCTDHESNPIVCPAKTSCSTI